MSQTKVFIFTGEWHDTRGKNVLGQKLDAIYFNAQQDLKSTVTELEEKRIKTYESDVDPVRRFLIERFINAHVKLYGKLRSERIRQLPDF